jgi:hypothetical protein
MGGGCRDTTWVGLILTYPEKRDRTSSSSNLAGFDFAQLHPAAQRCSSLRQLAQLSSEHSPEHIDSSYFQRKNERRSVRIKMWIACTHHAQYGDEHDARLPAHTASEHAERPIVCFAVIAMTVRDEILKRLWTLDPSRRDAIADELLQLLLADEKFPLSSEQEKQIRELLAEPGPGKEDTSEGEG